MRTRWTRCLPFCRDALRDPTAWLLFLVFFGTGGAFDDGIHHPSMFLPLFLPLFQR